MQKVQNLDEVILNNSLFVDSNIKRSSEREISLFQNHYKFKSNNFSENSFINRTSIDYNAFNQNLSFKSINSNSNYEQSIGIDRNYNSYKVSLENPLKKGICFNKRDNFLDNLNLISYNSNTIFREPDESNNILNTYNFLYNKFRHINDLAKYILEEENNSELLDEYNLISFITKSCGKKYYRYSLVSIYSFVEKYLKYFNNNKKYKEDIKWFHTSYKELKKILKNNSYIQPIIFKNNKSSAFSSKSQFNNCEEDFKNIFKEEQKNNFSQFNEQNFIGKKRFVEKKTLKIQ